MIREYIRRILRLAGGLFISSTGITMMLQAGIGAEPWSVFHQGIARTLGLTYGMASILVGAAVVGVAIACGESFGIGTLGDVLLCGIYIDTLTPWIPQAQTFQGGILMLLCGLELLTLGAFFYMRSALGVGPRDSLMVALARRTGRSVGLCRATVDVMVVFAGWRLGGQVGVGTLIAALGLGTLFNLNFALLHFNPAVLRQENLAETVRRLRGVPAKR